MGAAITKIEYFLPNKIVTNENLAARFENWSAEKVFEKVGIKYRHVAGDHETAVDLAIEACLKLFQSINKNDIDFLIFCTQSPDYFLPTSACVLQHKLGLLKNIGAIDINQGCSGFVYGLALAKGLITSNIAKNVLLVTSETYTKHINPLDKSNLSIFGDAAAATLISFSTEEKIFEFELGTDGEGMNNLIVQNGAFRNPNKTFEDDKIDESGNLTNPNFLYMNGPEIFNFTIQNIPLLVKNVLLKNNKKIEELQHVVFHQANKFMLEYLKKKIKIEDKIFYINLENTGNTVSSTIPIALKEMQNSNSIKPDDSILLAGFGVGYSWGATIIKF